MKKKLYRCRKNRLLYGVFGGLGDYFQIDPVIFRLGFIALSIFTGIFPLIIAYFILVFIIPEEPTVHKKNPYKKLFRSKNDRKIAGVLGGIAKYFHMDSMLLRIIFVILMLFTGFFPLFITYLIAWAVILKQPSSYDLEI